MHEAEIIETRISASHFPFCRFMCMQGHTFVPNISNYETVQPEDSQKSSEFLELLMNLTAWREYYSCAGKLIRENLSNCL